MKQNFLFNGIALLTAIIGGASGIAPKFLPFALGLFVILAAAYQIADKQRIDCFGNTSLLVSIAMAFSGYVGLSFLWSVHFIISIEKAAMMALVIVAGCIARELANSISKPNLIVICKYIITGMIVGILYVTIELAKNYQILSYIGFYFSDLSRLGNVKPAVLDHHLNKNMVSIVILLWPVLLLTTLNVQKKLIRMRIVIFIIGTTIISAALSSSETAKIALIVGGASFLLAWKLPRLTYHIARSLWIVVVIAIVPLVMVLYSAGVKENTSVQISGRDRIYIWNHTAKQVLKKPVLGHGIRSSRYAKEDAGPVNTGSETVLLTDRLGWHSHNIFLQTWFDLGAVGVGFLLAIGWLILRKISALQIRIQPYAYAGFSTFCTVGFFGYGMWQSWLMASLGCLIVFFLIAFASFGPVLESDGGFETPAEI